MSFLFSRPINVSRIPSTQQLNSTSTAQNIVQLPVNLLEALIPGYSTISGLLSEVFGFDITLIVSISFVGFALIKSADFLQEKFLFLLTRFGTCSVSMDSDIDAYFFVTDWLRDRDIGKSTRSLRAMAGSRSNPWQVMPDNSLSIHVGGGPLAPPLVTRKGSKSVRYEPSLGSSQYFWHDGKLFLWYRQKQRQPTQSPFDFIDGPNDRIEARLYCLSCSTGPIKALIEEAAAQYRKKSSTQTSIRRPAPSKQRRGGMSPWIKVATRPSRPMETVVLDHIKKDRILADIEEYLAPSTRQWYAGRGIPYRRGYLLFGPSGTGKSSLAVALAGHFDLDIYCISLQEPTITEEDLFTLFDELPEQCLLMLEDIDTAGLAVRNGPTTQGQRVASGQASESDADDHQGLAEKHYSDHATMSSSSTRISLSGLLNAIDGIASHEGRVLIMTTNHIDKLDSALLRPGRVDLRVKFELATRKQAEGLFMQIFSTGVTMGDSSNTTESGDAETEKVVEKKQRRPEMALAFATEIPEAKLSAAEILGFLLMRKKKPADAVAEVRNWIMNIDSG